MRRSRRGGRLFYGWWVALAAFGVLFVTVGAGLYAPPVFLVPLQQAFGWSRAAIAFATSIAALVAALASPLTGMAVDRLGARRVIAAGSLVMGLAFLALAGIRSLLALYALNVIAALGVSAAAWVPCQALISRWFVRRRGLAMGLTLAGIGFGGLAMTSLADLWIRHWGWRQAYFGLGASILLLVVPLAAIVIRSDPADLGLAPDGDDGPLEARPPGIAAPAGAATDPPEAAAAAAEIPLTEALASSAFWLIFVLGFAMNFASMAIVGHLVAFLRDGGYAPALAARSLGLVVGVSVAGRVLFGFLADRWGKRQVMAAGLGLFAAATVFLMRPAGLVSIVAFVLLFGLALGGTAVLYPLLLAECFGIAAFGRLLGLSMVAAALGVAVGPVLTGRIFDVSGSYDLAWEIHFGAFLLSAACALAVRPPRSVRAGGALAPVPPARRPRG